MEIKIMSNKSAEKVTLEMEVIKKAMAALQTQQTRLNTLFQFQQQQVVRENSAWTVANGRLQITA
jgi:hypothetical protein